MSTSRSCCVLLAVLCAGLLSPSVAAADPVDFPDIYEDRVEFGLFPLVGGDSDYGVALGAIMSLASFKPHAKPYLWRLELNGLATAKRDGGWQVPYQDYYVKLTLPAMLHNTLAISVRLAYTDYSTLHYWGLGNASKAPISDSGPRYNEFQLGYPHGTFEITQKLITPFLWRAAVDYYYERSDVYPDSLVDRDLHGAAALVGAGAYSLGLVTGLFGIDTRDNDLAPQTGQYHTVALRVSPHLGAHMPYGFAGVNATVRVYQALGTPRLVLAARVVGDGLVGNVPFYMLAESADGYAFGGVSGVRGIPAQRYYGKIKLYSSVELRLTFPSHRAFSQDITWGLVGFVDGGRLWADWHAQPQLDGTAVGLKYGAGGGIRLQFGSTLLIRGDVAYSPDASPVSFYFNVGHAF